MRNLKRVFSLFLACVMMLGILPTGVLAAPMRAAAGGGGGGGGGTGGSMPETITISKTAPIKEGQYNFYNNVIGAANSSYLNNFNVAVNGQSVTAFCGDHARYLGKGCREKGDVYKKHSTFTSAENSAYMWLDYYYDMEFRSKEFEAAHPDMSEDELKAEAYRIWGANNEEGPFPWLCEYERDIIETWVQVIVWILVNNPTAFDQVVNYDTPEGKKQLEAVAHERMNCLKWLGQNTTSVPDWAAAQGAQNGFDVSYLLCKNTVDAWKNHEYERYTYYVYELHDKKCTTNKPHQPIIVAQPRGKTVNDPGEGWVKIRKVDEDGNPLAGAQFGVYADASCNVQLPGGTITTGADGWGYFQVTTRMALLEKGGSLTLYAKETQAPPKPSGGKYKLNGGIYNAECKDGSTQETAAPFNGGQPIVDRAGDDDTTTGDDDTILRKVDAVDGSGVGPATFHFEGTEYDPEKPGPVAPKDGDYTTLNDGTLELQWWNPAGENYCPPGTYSVREKIPPEGYKLSDQVEELTLWLEDDGQGGQIPRHSGPLVFQNYKKPTVELIKVDDAANRLPGAVFDIYRDGQKIGTETTDETGTIRLVDVPDGYYSFYEVSAPAGYFLPFKRNYSLDVRAENAPEGYTYKLTAVNYRYTTILIQKQSRGTEEPVAGAVMEVMIDGELLGRYTTGASGTIEITYEEYGEFLHNHGLENKESWTVSVREVVAPEGYLIDDDNWQTAELHQGELLKPFVFTDTKYPEVWVRKVDRESKLPLAGASFKILIDGVDIGGPFVTDETGWVKITYEDYKNFLQDFNDPVPYNGWGVTVTEVNTPEFYNKDKQTDSGDYTKTGTLGPQASKITFEFEDTHYRDLLVKKKDSETGWPLKGAKFLLESVKLEETGQNNGGTWRQELETDENGEALFKNVPNGTYRLLETQAPQGYTKSDEVKTVVVTSDSQRVIEFEWENSPKSGFRILKVDAVTGEPIAGVRFRIRQLAPLTGVDIEATTDENGVIVREDLTAGTYEVTELDAPEPYRDHIDRNPRTIEIKDMHDAVPITITNQADGMLYILKLDGVTGEPLAGAYFTLETAGGTFVANVGPTGPNGYASYSPLLPGGSYVVKEIRAPEGHEIDPTPQVFQVPEDASGFVKSLIFDNMPWANLWLRKVDAQTGLGLEGAVFKITKGDGTVVKQNAITDQGGYIKVNGLEAGTYIATETRAPEGYTLDPTPHTIVLRQDDTEVVIIKNAKPGGLAIRKVDAATGDPLKGASFQLYDINDKPLGQPVVTGEDGYARWSDLPKGQYMVEEVAAPEGYVRDEHRRKIEVKDFEVTQYTWTNTQNATISIYKRDGETLLPLGGAWFEV